MLQVEISASVRNTSGKGPMRQLRMQGMTPAVVYGLGSKALNLQLESKKLMSQLLEFYRKNAVVTLKVDGEKDRSVIVGEVQTDPVRDTLVHVDFCEIDMTKDRAFNVPVSITGQAKGVDLGGQLFVNCSHVVIKGKPLDIPDECLVDISPMLIGDQIKSETLAIEDNVTMITEPGTVVVSIVQPGVEPEEEIEEEEGEEAVPEEEPAAE